MRMLCKMEQISAEAGWDEEDIKSKLSRQRYLLFMKQVLAFCNVPLFMLQNARTGQLEYAAASTLEERFQSPAIVAVS